jgi:hypothetical protein
MSHIPKLNVSLVGSSQNISSGSTPPQVARSNLAGMCTCTLAPTSTIHLLYKASKDKTSQLNTFGNLTPYKTSQLQYCTLRPKYKNLPIYKTSLRQNAPSTKHTANERPEVRNVTIPKCTSCKTKLQLKRIHLIEQYVHISCG